MKLFKIYRVLLLSATVTLLANIPSYAANTKNVGTFTKNADYTYTSNVNNRVYYLGGTLIKAYVPYDPYTASGTEIKTAMQDGMFSVYQGVDSGSMMASAAFRYGTSKMQYYMKYYKDTSWDATREPKLSEAETNIDENFNVEYRYAGIAIDNTANGTIMANSFFPSDTLKAATATTGIAAPTLHGNDGTDLTLYYTGENVRVNGYSPQNLDPLNKYGGYDTVKAAKSTIWNASQAQITFEAWVARTQIGSKFKDNFQQYIDDNGLSITWYDLMNQYIEIDGDIKGSTSVVLYTTMEANHKYASYTIPAVPPAANMSAARIEIRDDKNSIVGTASSRSHSATSTYDDVMTEGNGKLEKGKIYTIHYQINLYAKNATTSETDKSADVYRFNDYTKARKKDYGSADSVSNPYTTTSISSISYGDSGPISTSSTKTKFNNEDYLVGTSYFAEVNFQVPDEVTTTGAILLKVPAEFASINATANDDTLIYIYSLDGKVVGCDPETEECDITIYDQFSDMNLGQRELRRLHWYKEDTIEVSAGTDENGEEQFEEETVYLEMMEEWENGPEDEVGDWDEGAYNAERWKSHSRREEKGFWEFYAWPDQQEDEQYKIWIEDESGHWLKDDIYVRDEDFRICYRVSHSRGENSIANPEVNSIVYEADNMYDIGEQTMYSGDYHSSQTLNEYSYTDVGHECTTGQPFVNVEARVSTKHGESGIYGDTMESPYQNGWESEHDSITRQFLAESDDMKIMEIDIKDSEGIVIYHADRYNSDILETTVCSYYDIDEGLTMKVVMEQTYAANHKVENPTVDIRVVGRTAGGSQTKTYIDSALTNYEIMGLNVRTTYDNIAFRPTTPQIVVSAWIDDIHNYDYHRENVWVDADDSFSEVLECTTADMAMTQDIELYNSKHNPQDYLTFGEYLDFKFDVKHIGNTERAQRVVGYCNNPNSTSEKYARNPLPKVNVTYLNEDTHMQIGSDSFILPSRLFPGLGTNGYASHEQGWVHKFVVPSYTTPSGNIAAYGNIRVIGEIDEQHDRNQTNVRNNITDIVEEVFKGEKDIKILDVGAVSRNSVTDKTGISVSIALASQASSYNDQTKVDKTYVQTWFDGELKDVRIVEIPVGDPYVLTEVILNDVELQDPSTIEVRVNTDEYQTHYEYVLKETNRSLHSDPFANNYFTLDISPNLPDKNVCPQCIVGTQDELTFGDGDTIEDPNGGAVVGPGGTGGTEETPEEGPGTLVGVWTGTVQDGTLVNVHMTGFTGAVSELTVPESIAIKGVTYPVASIGNGSENIFGSQSDSTVTAITVPSGINIEDNAFLGCTMLSRVNLQEGCTSIGNKAFQRCLSLREIRLPSSVQTIGSYAFNKCESLTTVSLNEGITRIENGAFMSCTALVDVTIPSSTTYLADNIFKNDSALLRVHFKDEGSLSIMDSDSVIPSTATIYGKKGYAAEDYANKFSRKFVEE